MTLDRRPIFPPPHGVADRAAGPSANVFDQCLRNCRSRIGRVPELPMRSVFTDAVAQMDDHALVLRRLDRR
jgi:hypothetical protein